jgi:hypothetical protein
MPRLSDADELLIHQVPVPFGQVQTFHEHWRESYFFVVHAKETGGDVLVLTMATYPARECFDSFQLGRIDGEFIFALHPRAYDGDPSTPKAGPAEIEILKPYESIRLYVDGSHPEAPIGLDLRFTARTRPYGLRRGTMRARHEIIWDQSQMIQSGHCSGTYQVGDRTIAVDDWWCQRDHSWGIRDHSRCPLWMWLAIQLSDGMFSVWNWEYTSGARVYTDGCWSPADGSDPVPVIGFEHRLHWTDIDGEAIDYGSHGLGVVGLAGTVVITLEEGRRIEIEAEGRRCVPYRELGGGLHEMNVRTDDGRSGQAIYEVTGAHHHHFFPIARGENLPPGD